MGRHFIMNDTILPLGKLPAPMLARLLARAPVDDPRVVVGPGIGLDCAVVEMGDTLLVCKADPITFVTGEVGRYLVQVNANDVVTTGATPCWLLVTLLLPEHRTTAESVEGLLEDIYAACRAQDISVVGGHTEITHGIDRPLAVGALLGTVKRDKLITPMGAKPGDRLLLTKGVPIEGTSILARERADRLRTVLTEAELITARNFLSNPGISVVRDARIAVAAGTVSAMHDPTEGGLAAALWELAEASGRSLHVDLARVPVARVSVKICAAFGIDPLETIASGALLITAPGGDAARISTALEEAGIPCHEIGEIRDGPPAVYRRTPTGEERLAWPERDGVARVFESQA
jgi:hydrogenase maturation factor